MTQDEIVKLNPAERIALIGAIWDSMADSDAPLPAAQRNELLRRLESFDDDRAQALSSEAVKAKMDQRGP